MNNFRRGLVNQIFSKLDKDGDGVIRVNINTFKIKLIFFINF
jgi:hypothetical protein